MNLCVPSEFIQFKYKNCEMVVSFFFFACFLFKKKIVLGRDSYYVALIYLYMSYYGNKKQLQIVVGAYDTHFSSTLTFFSC